VGARRAPHRLCHEEARAKENRAEAKIVKRQAAAAGTAGLHRLAQCEKCAAY
jgi:hypothetical protein